MNLKLFLESLLEILFPQRLHWLCSQVYLYWKKFSTTIPFILTKLPIYNMINSKSLFKWLTFWLDINDFISNILISEMVVITQFFDVITVNIIQKLIFLDVGETVADKTLNAIMALTAYYHLLHNIKRALKCTKYLYTKETGCMFFNAITVDSSTLVTKWFNLKRRENVLRKEHISVEQYSQYNVLIVKGQFALNG